MLAALGNIGREIADVGRAAGFLEQAVATQPFGQRDQIARLVGIGQIGQTAKQQPVILAVEIVLADRAGDVVPRLFGKQQTADHRLFGLDGMRGQLGFGHGRVGFR